MGDDYCIINPMVTMEYCLGIQDGEVVLVRYDRDDPYKLWNRIYPSDGKYDYDGRPAFALFNKATGKALQHANGPHQQLQLDEDTEADPDNLPDRVLFTQSGDCGHGDEYRAIRMYPDTSLNVDAYEATEDKEYLDGTKIVVWEWAGGPNQLWWFNDITV